MAKRVPKKWIRTDADRKAIREGCWFDDAAGKHACDFVETYVCYTTGDVSKIGTPVVLLPWQRDFLMRLFGWKRKNGRRRFTSASVWVAKKNGKTTLCAWILLYLLVADGEMSSEVFSVANSTKQAAQILKEADKVVKASPELSKWLETIPSSYRIIFPATNSYYQVLSSRADTTEGVNAHGFIFDELHRQKHDDLFNAVRWAGSSRNQPLFITISTVGIFDPTSIAWRQYKIAKDILQGIDAETTDLLPIIYEIDPEDDWTTKNPKCEQVWRKANPSLGTTIRIDNFRREVEATERNPSGLSAFLRYRLNRWASSSTSWITDDVWQRCQGDTDLTQDQINSMNWTAGLDLASSVDINALVLVGDLDGKIYVKPFYWVAAEQASLRQKRDQVNYETWSKQGHIRTTPGEAVDFEFIRRDVKEICEQYPVAKLGIDRWSAPMIAQGLQGDGLPVCYYGQGYKDMSPAVKEIERLVYSQELVHNCPVLRWMMSNVEIESDAAGNVKISKKRSREKVDGCTAMAQAIGLRMVAEEKPSVYESRGILSL